MPIEFVILGVLIVFLLFSALIQIAEAKALAKYKDFILKQEEEENIDKVKKEE